VDTDRQFPCLDDSHLYSGCLGAGCPIDRCWTGRRLRTSGGPVRPDAYDKPLKVLRYTASECAACKHAVDLMVGAGMRSAGGRTIKRWTICDQELWASPASLYNLVHHRAPKKIVGPCPSFTATPPAQLRPEVIHKRKQDLARSRARRARVKEAKLAKGATVAEPVRDELPAREGLESRL